MEKKLKEILQVHQVAITKELIKDLTILIELEKQKAYKDFIKACKMVDDEFNKLSNLQ